MRCTCHYGNIVESRLELGAKRRRLALALSPLKKGEGIRTLGFELEA
jgi:hypothetical protein